MKCKVNIGKIALLLCNFIFLLSGFCLILLGCVLLNDAPRILLSHLAFEPGTIPEPLLYYVALGFVTAGMVVSSVALLGCWTSLGPESNCLMAFYIFLLVVLLLVEISFGAVGSLCPQAFGAGMDRDQMVASLMNNYGVPGRDKYTAAVDLAQTIFECCGMQSGSDFDGSIWWKREQDTQHNLRVPRSCCFLQNTGSENAFLDPIPVNLTLCQAKNNARYQLGRHVKGCIDQLNTWFKDHITIFLIIGLALIVVQLSVLLCAIIVCLRKKKSHPLLVEGPNSERPSLPNVDKQKLHMESSKNGCDGKNSASRTEDKVSDSQQNGSGKKRINNYSFKNFNYLDFDESGDSKYVDNVRNEDDSRSNLYGKKYLGERTKDQRTRQAIACYPSKFPTLQNPLNSNDLQYEAMRQYFRSGNGLSSNDRCETQVGT